MSTEQLEQELKEERHDKQLFTQPDSSYLGECPLCCLPLPLDAKKSTLMSCCCKIICNGCERANKKREIKQGLEQRCAFCREPSPDTDEETEKRIMERVKKKDPVALTKMGKRHFNEGDFGKALEYLTKAAELGDADAHCGLAILYYNGYGVEKDMEKTVYHWEQAAIGGHPVARASLAVQEMKNGRFDRAVSHLIIAANLGHDTSLQEVKGLFVQGKASKEDYAAALRGYQAAVGAAKSAERDKADPN